MIITEDIEFRTYLVKRIEEREFGERTGVHMSDLNYCLNKQIRNLKPSTHSSVGMSWMVLFLSRTLMVSIVVMLKNEIKLHTLI